jgi:predicted Zn-dependent protease
MPGVAIHFLERAVELGYIAAYYSLAIQWIYLQQVDKARVNLNEYLKHFPEDESAKQVLQSLDSNELAPAFTNFGDQSPAQLPPS